MSESLTAAAEIIAIASGKGGTGKTLITACLGYALTNARHRVLMVDADLATDGLSLMLLGPQGTKNIGDFRAENTFKGALQSFAKEGTIKFNPYPIDRSGPKDHGVIYQALISGKGIYGDLSSPTSVPTGSELDRTQFRTAIRQMFGQLRSSGTFDYVLVDTRGGFGFETTDICALADSFIVVTDPDYTSFFQDRNLVKRIGFAASEIATTSLLRAIVVNRSTEADEKSFRLELVKEFPIKFDQTFPIPLDIEAIKAYKTQALPYVAAPASQFAYATLTAFSEILHKVTARWHPDRVAQWNILVKEVSDAIEKRNADIKSAEQEEKERAEKLTTLFVENQRLLGELESLRRELVRSQETYKTEVTRAEAWRVSLEHKYQSEIAYLRTQIERSHPTTKDTEEPFFRRVLRQPFVLGILLLLTALPFLWQALYRSKSLSPEEQLLKVYKTDAPPAVRILTLKDLLKRGNTQFDSIDLSGLNLSELRLEGVNLRGAKLAKTDLTKTNLHRANLSESILDNANLSFALLDDANLTDTSLNGANLHGALLRNAILRRTDFIGADLLDADLQGADMRTAILLNAKVMPDQLKGAKIDSSTVLPVDPAPLGPLLNSVDERYKEDVSKTVRLIQARSFSEAVRMLQRIQSENPQLTEKQNDIINSMLSDLQTWSVWQSQINK